MTLLEWCQSLEVTPLAEWVTQSEWGFVIPVGSHLLGLGLSVGLIIWMDLRLLGRVMVNIPAARVYRGLAPWIAVGFVVMFASGIVLFVAYASSAYANVYFRIKLAALLAAGVNAAMYHVVTERRLAQAAAGTPMPFSAKATGLISMSAWAIVVFAGRMMSYTMF